jgi:integrase
MGVKVKERIPGSGVFWIFINHNGRRKAKKVGSEDAARKAKAMIEARLVLGNSALPQESPTAPILEDYCKRWRETYLETAVKESTRNSYMRTFERWILPVLGKVPLNEITREKVEHFAGSLSKARRNRKDESGAERETGLSKDSIRLYLAPLRGLLNHAIEHGIIRENPASKPGKMYKQAKRMHEEIQP